MNFSQLIQVVLLSALLTLVLTLAGRWLIRHLWRWLDRQLPPRYLKYRDTYQQADREKPDNGQ